ncbi:hypothetical protein ACWDZ4_20275 [Streptomyces sp. NPDC003016]
MTNWTPKLTNVKGTDGTVGTGEYVESNGVATFTAQIVAKTETFAVDSAGFGLTLPVPAKTGTRYVFALSLDGRDADQGIWTGEAQIYAGADGNTIERLRTVGDMANGAALQNVTHVYGGDKGEIITVTGSYLTA